MVGVLSISRRALLTVILAENWEELSLRQTSYRVVIALVNSGCHKPSLLADPQDLLDLVCIEVRNSKSPEGSGFVEFVDTLQRFLDGNAGVRIVKIVYINLSKGDLEWIRSLLEDNS